TPPTVCHPTPLHDALPISVPAPVTPLAPPSALTYPVTTATYHLDSLITTNTPTVTGTVDTFYVVPALPAGLVLNPVTGAISGTRSEEHTSELQSPANTVCR